MQGSQMSNGREMTQNSEGGKRELPLYSFGDNARLQLWMME